MSNDVLRLNREEQSDLARRLHRRTQSSEYRIRQACLEDCAQLAWIQVDSYQSAYRGLFPEDYLAQFTYAEQEQDWRTWMMDHLQETFLVAELAEGQIAGYVRGASGSELVGYDCELAGLHVRQEQQGGGIGAALFQAFSQKMSTQNCRKMMLWVLSGNQRARGFYEHLGGCQVGEKRWLMDDFEVVEVAYGWDLAEADFQERML